MVQRKDCLEVTIRNLGGMATQPLLQFECPYAFAQPVQNDPFSAIL